MCTDGWTGGSTVFRNFANVPKDIPSKLGTVIVSASDCSVPYEERNTGGENKLDLPIPKLLKTVLQVRHGTAQE
jgi:hypothetical protein